MTGIEIALNIIFWGAAVICLRAALRGQRKNRRKSPQKRVLGFPLTRKR